MNQRPIIRLFILTSCFFGGIRSAPIDSDDESLAETISTRNGSDPRALSIPFLPSKGETDKDKPLGFGLTGLPGLSEISSATAGGQVFFGAILPLPKLADMINMFEKLGGLANLAGNFPTLPSLPNLPNTSN